MSANKKLEAGVTATDRRRLIPQTGGGTNRPFSAAPSSEPALARAAIPRVAAVFWLLAALFAQVSALPADPAVIRLENVLDLDGNESYLELPPTLFTNEVVTVEGWVKWRQFNSHSRFFAFFDAAIQMDLLHLNTGPTLLLEHYRA